MRGFYKASDIRRDGLLKIKKLRERDTLFEREYLQEPVPIDHDLMKLAHKLSATQIQRELKCSAREACDLRKQAMEYHRQLLKEPTQ